MANDGFPFPRSPMRRLGFLAGAVILSFVATSVATSAQAVTLSGTFDYSGSLGPVSASGPLRIWVAESSDFGEAIASAAITTNGGAWSVDVPQAGDYYLLYWLDRDGDLFPGSGEPVEVYHDKFTLAVEPDPLPAPRSGVELTLNDTWVLATVSGRVTYVGNYPVRPGPALSVTSYARPDLTSPRARALPVPNGGSYTALALGEQAYLRVHYDLIVRNDNYDPGEPYVIYNQRRTPPANPIAPGSVVDIVFGDEYAPTTTHITGTVTYSGSRGAVSAARPILILVLHGPDDFNEIGRRTITSNGAFDIALPAPGNQYLIYAWDMSGEGILVGAPFEIYDDRFSFPVEPLVAPTSEVTLQFDDTARIPGIAGTASYTGNHGPVSQQRRIVLEAFKDAALTQRVVAEEVFVNGGRYGLVSSDLAAPLLYVRAFLDVDRNEELDEGEPYGVCSAPIQSGPDQTNVLISFGDGGGATCSVLTPITCVGDCDGGGAVDVTKIIKMVNIALGVAPVTDCAGGDPDNSGTIDVTEIIQAVNNALSGC